jgi:hypothetical protein
MIRGTIRKGAFVSQDHCFFDFYECYGLQHLTTEFSFEWFGDGMYKGKADGFGMLKGGEYGNGAIYLKEEDIVSAEVYVRYRGAGI